MPLNLRLPAAQQRVDLRWARMAMTAKTIRLVDGDLMVLNIICDLLR